MYSMKDMVGPLSGLSGNSDFGTIMKESYKQSNQTDAS